MRQKIEKCPLPNCAYCKDTTKNFEYVTPIGEDPADVVQYSRDFSGEESPYQQWVQKKVGTNWEPEQANADSIDDEDGVFFSELNDYKALLLDCLASVKLSEKERRVLNAFTRGDRTQDDVARLLGMSRMRVQQCLLRIKRKVEKLYGIKKAQFDL
jgi:DNA-directed RNA polymerase sigma subunit (sigma70/sigma32)